MSSKVRYFSLDVFRGATVALMILVNNPGSWSYVYPFLEHASWNGCTPTADLVFPFFLFAVGNSLSFVMPSLAQQKHGIFWRKIIKRSLLIFLIGLFLNWLPFVKWDHDALVFKAWTGIRIMGVLQRIALCYFFAAIILRYCSLRISYVLAGALLIGYYLLCIFLGDPQMPFSIFGWFGTYYDVKIFGISHIYQGEGIPFEVEGLLSTIPAIAQVMIGYFIGHWLQKQSKNFDLIAKLLLIGCVLTFIGYVWDYHFPINKKIWSSSFVMYTSGLAVVVMTFLIYFIEIKKNSANIFTNFCTVFGKNPLFIFIMSGAIPRIFNLVRIPDGTTANGLTNFVNPFTWFYDHICTIFSANLYIDSLIYAFCFIIFMFLLGYVLDRKGIYIKV
ncbi:MAG: hypothetical protein QM528_08545 [Phycisphaerales bacterium]|nr:hypothetical protein [Phycisphaerales bacterium]